jgi:hypothetical protein
MCGVPGPNLMGPMATPPCFEYQKHESMFCTCDREDVRIVLPKVLVPYGRDPFKRAPHHAHESSSPGLQEQGPHTLESGRNTSLCCKTHVTFALAAALRRLKG